MNAKLPVISFFVGLLVADLAYRITDAPIFRVAMACAVGAAAVAYLMQAQHDLVRDVAFPFSGGFFVGGLIKWVFMAVLS